MEEKIRILSPFSGVVSTKVPTKKFPQNAYTTHQLCGNFRKYVYSDINFCENYE